MHRRQFLRSVPLAAASVAAAGLAHAEGFPVGEPKMKRFEEQRWVLDNIIQANGIDWDQGHTSTLLRACGLGIQEDMANWRQRDVSTAYIGTTIRDPFVNYAKLAKALGHVGIGPISDPKELGAALKRGIEAVKMGEPVLIDVVTQPR